MPDKIITFSSKYDSSHAPELVHAGLEARVFFNGSCRKQDKVTQTHGKIENIYIVYKLSPTLNNFDFALENCLFGAIKLKSKCNNFWS